jgi:hypothetical protein
VSCGECRGEACSRVQIDLRSDGERGFEGTMPAPPASAGASARTSVPAPSISSSPDLIDRVLDLLDRLPRAALIELRDAITAQRLPQLPAIDLPILRDLQAAGIAADVLEEIANRLALSPSRSPNLNGTEAGFQRFWSRCRIQTREADCRKLFFALPWHQPHFAHFARDFFEGLDRAELTERWQRGKVEPYWWLRQEGWNDRFFGSDGKPLKGAAERKREADEARAVNASLNAAQVSPARIFKPVDPPKVRTPLEAAIIERIGVDRFDTWFTGQINLRLDGTRLIVTAPNPMCRDWISTTFKHALLAAARDIAGDGASLDIVTESSRKESS